MARPIRNTPILTGDDAIAFNIAAEVIPSESERMAERARLEASVEKFRQMLEKLP